MRVCVSIIIKFEQGVSSNGSARLADHLLTCNCCHVDHLSTVMGEVERVEGARTEGEMQGRGREERDGR